MLNCTFRGHVALGLQVLPLAALLRPLTSDATVQSTCNLDPHALLYHLGVYARRPGPPIGVGNIHAQILQPRLTGTQRGGHKHTRFDQSQRPPVLFEHHTHRVPGHVSCVHGGLVQLCAVDGLRLIHPHELGDSNADCLGQSSSFDDIDCICGILQQLDTSCGGVNQWQAQDLVAAGRQARVRMVCLENTRYVAGAVTDRHKGRLCVPARNPETHALFLRAGMPLRPGPTECHSKHKNHRVHVVSGRYHMHSFDALHALRIDVPGDESARGFRLCDGLHQRNRLPPVLHQDQSRVL